MRWMEWGVVPNFKFVSNNPDSEFPTSRVEYCNLMIVWVLPSSGVPPYAHIHHTFTWCHSCDMCSSSMCYTEHKLKNKKTGDRVSFGGPLLAFTCLPPLGYAENPINSSLYKSFTAIINGKLCLCENSPRFHQIASNKIKISRGAHPQTLLLCHMLCTQICTCSPNNLYNLILLPPPSPLGKKLKETLGEAWERVYQPARYQS